MKKVKCDKLVRDMIVEHMLANNIASKCKTRKVSGEEYGTYLLTKLIEESIEVAEAKTDAERIEEVGDLLTVIDAVKRHFYLDADEVEKARRAKTKLKGAFREGIVLEEVDYYEH